MSLIKKKGQGAIEFIIIFVFVLVFFIVFLAVIQQNQGEKEKEKQDMVFQNLALDARDEINLASGASEGYSRNFSIPEKVFGKEFEINVTPTGNVYLVAERYAVSFRASNVTGDFIKGINTIKKENGTVHLN